MKRLGLSIALVVLIAGLVAQVASAHPLGNFSVNRYSRLDVSREEIRLRYVLDLAEIPTLQELRSAGIQGSADLAAQQALLQAKSAELVRGAQLTVDGQRASWSVQETSIEMTPGQADLDTMRVSLLLITPVGVRDGARLEYRDGNYAGRAGWHEVVVRSGAGINLGTSSVPSQDRSDELRSYPQEAEQAPLDVSAATATVRWGALNASHEATGAPSGVQGEGRRVSLDPRADQLGSLLRTMGGANPVAILVALIVAAGLGALHALEPGHGKTVVGSYLVGSRGTARHALLLGLTVTVTHTLGVYLLGLVTLVAAQYVVPERLYPILGVTSGLVVVVIGLSLLRSRLHALSPLMARLGFLPGGSGAQPQMAMAHGVAHTHPYPAHAHPHPDVHGELAKPSYGPDHAHDHHHVHPHDHDHDHDHVHNQGPYGSAVPHSHAWGRPHTHVPAAPDGGPVTIRSLLALGVSGGLLPCPAALVVLLAAVSFHSVALGMLLVAAFSVGLATVLTALGLLILYGGRILGRSSLAGTLAGTGVAKILPALSAIAVTIAGFAIAAQAASALP